MKEPTDDELLVLFGKGQNSYEGWLAIWRDGARRERERLLGLADELADGPDFRGNGAPAKGLASLLRKRAG